MAGCCAVTGGTLENGSQRTLSRRHWPQGPEHGVIQGWLKGYGKETRLVRQVFTNKDGSTGILHLACSDITDDYEASPRATKKRVASGCISQEPEIQRSFGEVPKQTLRTQSSHIFMSIYAALQAPMFECQDQTQL